MRETQEPFFVFFSFIVGYCCFCLPRYRVGWILNVVEIIDNMVVEKYQILEKLLQQFFKKNLQAKVIAQILKINWSCIYNIWRSNHPNSDLTAVCHRSSSKGLYTVYSPFYCCKTASGDAVQGCSVYDLILHSKIG